MTTQYEPTREQRAEARRMMSAMMFHAYDAQEVVGAMVRAMCGAGLPSTNVVQGMTAWAEGEVTAYVASIVDRFGYLA